MPPDTPYAPTMAKPKRWVAAERGRRRKVGAWETMDATRATLAVHYDIVVGRCQLAHHPIAASLVRHPLGAPSVCLARLVLRVDSYAVDPKDAVDVTLVDLPPPGRGSLDTGKLRSHRSRMCHTPTNDEHGHRRKR